MSLLGNIGGILRKGVDDVGGAATATGGFLEHQFLPPSQPSPQTPGLTVNSSPGMTPMTQQMILQRIGNTPTPNVNQPGIQVNQQAQPPHPNLLHQAGGLIGRNVVNPLLSADKFIANNTGLTDAAKVMGVIPGNQQQSGINLVKGAVKFPIQAGQQLANTGLQATHTQTNDVPGTNPSLQHLYQQTKKTNGTLPAALQTGFAAVSDVAPLLGAVKPVADTAKTVTKIPDNIATKQAIDHPSSQALLQHINQQKALLDQANSLTTKDQISKSIAQNSQALSQNIDNLKNQYKTIGAVGKDVNQGINPDELHTPNDHVPVERTPDEELVQSVASEYQNPKDFIKDTAESAYNYDKSVKGGQLQRVDDGTYGGTFNRTTEHTPFYSEFYAANKRAPTLRDFTDQVQHEMETGQHEITHPDERGIYQILQDRESANQGLNQAPEAAPKLDKNGQPTLKIQDNQVNKIKITKKPSTTKQIDIANVPKDQIQTGDQVMANTLGISPARAAKIRMTEAARSQRNASAESAALEHLKNGGVRDEAIKIYAKQAGVSEKMAKYRVMQAAKQAEQSLNVSKATPNPLLKDFKLPRPKTGDFETVASNRRAVINSIEHVENRSIKAVDSLSPEDKSNFIDYAQGVRNVADAKDPVAMQNAVDEWRRAADTTHALGENFGKTKHAEDFFPGYWDRSDPKVAEMEKLQAEQDMEEQYGTQEWNRMSEDEKAKALMEYSPHTMPGEDANYAGFHTKAKTFKNQAEGIEAGYKPMFDNPTDAMKRYFQGAKLSLGNQAIIQGIKHAEPVEEGQRYGINLPGGKPASVGKAGFKILKQESVKPPSILPIRLLKNTTRSIVKTIVANPLIHGQNQEFNSLFSAAWNTPGFKPANMMRVIRNQAELASKPAEYDKWRSEFYSKGGFSPTYGRDQYGFIAKGLEKAGIDPKHAEMSPRAMAQLEENIRVATYKMGREQGMAPDLAVKTVDNALGSSKLLGDMSSSFGLFLHYLITNVKILGRAGESARKGYFNPVIGIAAGYAAYLAANKAWQEITGNKNASVRAPGVIGTATQIAKAPSQVSRGQIPSVVTSHTNPLIRIGVEQATNRDLSKPIGGPEAANNKLSGPNGSGRVIQLAKDGLGPAQATMKVQSGKSSPAETALGVGLGLYTPHATGYQASPNILSLNTQGAKAGNGLDAQKVYYGAKDNAINSLGNSQKNVDTFNKYMDTERDPNNPNNILGRSPAENLARYKDLLANDSVRGAVQNMEKTLPNHDPMWDLSPDKLKTAIDYESQYAGDPERTRMEEQSPWLQQVIKDRSAWQQQQTYSGNYTPNPNTPAYPTFDAQTTQDLKDGQSITDPTQYSQFLASHPNVIQAENQIFNQYTNPTRVAQGALPLQPAPQPSQHVQDILNSFPQGTDKASKKAIAQLITSNPDVNQYLADHALWSTTKNLAGYYLQINPNVTEGQELNNGSPKAQTTLKNISSLGAYDIGKNPLTGAYNFMQGGTLASAGNPTGASAGGSGHSKRPKPPRVHIKPVRRIKMHHPKKGHVFLKTPPSPIRIRNKVNQHIGIKRTTLV